MRYRLSLGIVAASLVFSADAQRPPAKETGSSVLRPAQHEREGSTASGARPPVLGQAQRERAMRAAPEKPAADPWRRVYADAGAGACDLDVRSIVVNGDVLRYATRLSLADGTAVPGEWIGDCDAQRPQPVARYREIDQNCGRLALVDICARRTVERRVAPAPPPAPVVAGSRGELLRERSALMKDLERNRSEQRALRAKDVEAEGMQMELRTEPASDVFMALHRLYRRQAVIDERRTIGHALAEKEAQEAALARRIGEVDRALR